MKHDIPFIKLDSHDHWLGPHVLKSFSAILLRKLAHYLRYFGNTYQTHS